MNVQIATKDVDAVTIAALTSIVPDTGIYSAGPVLRSLFGQVIERMEVVTADRTTPIARQVALAGRPEVEADIVNAYQNLAHWAESNGHHNVLDAPTWRHHFLEADGEDETDWIVELQLELSFTT